VGGGGWINLFLEQDEMRPELVVKQQQQQQQQQQQVNNTAQRSALRHVPSKVAQL